MLLLISLLDKKHPHKANPNFLFEYFGLHKDFLHFHDFLQTADRQTYNIMNCFRLSQWAGDVVILSSQQHRELIKKCDYVDWARRKKFPLPEFFETELVYEENVLSTAGQVRTINFSIMNDAPASCLLLNLVAKFYLKSEHDLKVSDCRNKKAMKEVIKLIEIATNEGESYSEDWFRNHVENQFKRKSK